MNIMAFLEHIIDPALYNKSIKRFLHENGRNYQREKERKKAIKISHYTEFNTIDLDDTSSNDIYSKLNMKILLDHMKRHYEIFPKRYKKK